MKIISFVIITLNIFWFQNNTQQISEKQREFLILLEIILKEKEVDKFLIENQFLWEKTGKDIFILNKNTPFSDESDKQHYSKKYRKKRMNITSNGALFFKDIIKYIEIISYNRDNDKAIMQIQFVDLNESNKGNKNFVNAKFIFKKNGKWRLKPHSFNK